MAYSQSKKISYNEKKLTQLKQQLYGKELPTAILTPSMDRSFKGVMLNPTPAYLVRDMWKIAFWATIALGGQFALWYALGHSWLKLY